MNKFALDSFNKEYIDNLKRVWQQILIEKPRTQIDIFDIIQMLNRLLERTQEDLAFNKGMFTSQHDWEIGKVLSFLDMLSTQLNYLNDLINSEWEDDEAIITFNEYFYSKIQPKFDDFIAVLYNLVDVWEPNQHNIEATLGSMKVILIPSTKIGVYEEKEQHPYSFDDYIKHIQEAIALLKNKKLDKVTNSLTVKIFPPSESGENQYGKELGVAARYDYKTDEIWLFYPPNKYIPYILIHELGHRYYFKFMDAGQRDRYNAYFNQIPATSEYGKAHKFEDFAEAFSYYVSDAKMTEDQRARFERIIQNKDFRYRAAKILSLFKNI